MRDTITTVRQTYATEAEAIANVLKGSTRSGYCHNVVTLEREGESIAVVQSYTISGPAPQPGESVVLHGKRYTVTRLTEAWSGSGRIEHTWSLEEVEKRKAEEAERASAFRAALFGR